MTSFKPAKRPLGFTDKGINIFGTFSNQSFEDFPCFNTSFDVGYRLKILFTLSYQ